MENIVLAFIALGIVILFVYYFPLGLSKWGRIVLAGSSFFIALLAIFVGINLVWWQAVLILLLFALLTSIVLDRRFNGLVFADGGMSYREEDTEDMQNQYQLTYTGPKNNQQLDEVWEDESELPESYAPESDLLDEDELKEWEEQLETVSEMDQSGDDLADSEELVEFRATPSSEEVGMDYLHDYEESIDQPESDLLSSELLSEEEQMLLERESLMEEPTFNGEEEIIQEHDSIELQWREDLLNDEDVQIGDSELIEDEAEQVQVGREVLEEIAPTENVESQQELEQEGNLPEFPDSSIEYGHDYAEEERESEENWFDKVAREPIEVEPEENSVELMPEDIIQPSIEEPLVEERIEEKPLDDQEKHIEEEVVSEEAHRESEESGPTNDDTLEQEEYLEDTQPLPSDVEEDVAASTDDLVEEEVIFEEFKADTEDVISSQDNVKETEVTIEDESPIEEPSEVVLDEPIIDEEPSEVTSEVEEDTPQEEQPLRRTPLQEQLFHTMVEQIRLQEHLMNSVEYEQYIMDHIQPSLDDQDYFTFSYLLIQHYVKHNHQEALRDFLSDLGNRFNQNTAIKAQVELMQQLYVHS
ncbi:hypothetical protein N781_10545 [Pontibacillus halophilus JSM 076056 = DSM 19796]|uniref:Uncharacterized protein n=1 Tax=Pontibacillus halophilus JSM 076056 = DSM 19796 TaxID=1385510 RepID=A0A0A5GQW1_9BACI|nr:hypothetical protein [Pontibacillus halophilus]KGX93623.1 hypothetical protein N781_10545 [Pontibacillus halophilus JSM 076056 = DSM 19796]